MEEQERQLDRLRAWLARHGLDHGEGAALAGERPATRAAQVELLRLLNRIESRFDDVIAKEVVPPLDWQAVRDALHLAPAPRNPWSYIGARAQERFSQAGYPPAHCARADRLWRDFLFLQEDQVKPLQVPTGWVAALDYLLQALYFTSEVTQSDLATTYGISASTLGLRFRALVETLGIELFDHPARKRLAATRALTVERGRMSSDEFARRLLRGQLRGPAPRANSD